MKQTTPLISRSIVYDLVPFGNLGKPSNLYALSLSRPNWPNWYPGQFVMIRKAHNNIGLPWARPFAICRVSKDSLVIFFQAKGQVTGLMADLKPGDEVDMWGPLGNAFAVEPDNKTLIIAGGIGIAPFVSYIHEHPKPHNIAFLFGHTMPLDCYPFASLNTSISATSFYDSKPGDVEIFSKLLESRIAEHAASEKKNGLILACGPLPLLKKIQTEAKKHNVRAQISLETRMSCGVGACLGCIVQTIPGGDTTRQPLNVQTCTCGPNFWADSVIL